MVDRKLAIGQEKTQNTKPYTISYTVFHIPNTIYRYTALPSFRANFRQ